MEPTAVLTPMLTMIGFTLFVIVSLGVTRNIAVLSGRVRIKVFATFSEPGEPEGMIALRRNVANLFEVPTLYYALCLTAFATGTVDSTTVTLAWIFVASRVVHTAIHITYNNVLHRFLVFALGVAIIVVMLIRIAARM